MGREIEKRSWCRERSVGHWQGFTFSGLWDPGLSLPCASFLLTSSPFLPFSISPKSQSTGLAQSRTGTSKTLKSLFSPLMIVTRVFYHSKLVEGSCTEASGQNSQECLPEESAIHDSLVCKASLFGVRRGCELFWQTDCSH